MNHGRLGRATTMLALATLALLISSARGAEPIQLRAGRVSMLFDSENATLRYIKIGQNEILHGITAPIRDENWGTVVPQVSNIKLDNADDHFKLTFDAVCKARDIDFRWQGTVTGTKAGEVEFAFDGVAKTTFMRNRIGLCVLHGASAAGKPWVITHVDGEKSKGAFPTFIAPHQPAKQIRAIDHEFAKGAWAHVELLGEVFEMEDQRNWTDASFKTYCIPLEIPYPVKIEAGTKISHKARISVSGDLPADSPAEPRVTLTLGKQESRLPRLGLQVASETGELSQGQIDRLKQLKLDHLRVDVRSADESFAAKLRAADRQAKAIGAPLHLGVVLGKQAAAAEVNKFAEELKTLQPNASAYIINVTDWEQLKLARAALKDVAGKAQFGGAKMTNYVEINRDRPTNDELDLVSFNITPQIHAFDNLSMVETLPIQGAAVRSARQFLGQRPLLIGPITLRPPLADQKPAPGELPPDVDLRQSSAFAAAWTVGSVKSLAEAGARSATYYETVGWKGLMEWDAPPKRPAPVPTKPGEVFPVYQVFRELADFSGGNVQQLDSTEPQAVVGLSLSNLGKRCILLANLTDRKQPALLRGLSGPAKIALLDGRPIEQSLPNPIVIPPHAIVRIAPAK